MDHASDVDQEVARIRADHTHKFESVPVPEGGTAYCCTRCGRRETTVRLEDGSYIPCRGFVG